MAKLAYLLWQEFRQHFNLKSFLCISEHKVMACVLCLNMEQRGPAPSLYVTDSEAAFMKLVGGWVGAQIGRQHAQISVGKFFLSHAFGMQTLFSQRNSHKWWVSRLLGPARPDLLKWIYVRVLALLSFCANNFLEHPILFFPLLLKRVRVQLKSRVRDWVEACGKMLNMMRERGRDWFWVMSDLGEAVIGPKPQEDSLLVRTWEKKACLSASVLVLPFLLMKVNFRLA